MATPTVFLSSTCYDLSEIRDALGSFISSFGFQPCLSDKGDVFYHPDLHTHESCLNEVRNCQLFILVIGGRFGGSYIYDESKSIVNAEYSAAKELGIPVFTFVRKNVFDNHHLFIKNKDKEIIDQIEFPAIENSQTAKNIFKFIDDIRLSMVNNGIFPFQYSKEIEEILRKQWAGMFYDFLSKRSLSQQYDTQLKILSDISSISSKMEGLVEQIYRHVDEPNADTVIATAETKSKADKFFKEVFTFFSIDYLTVTIDYNKFADYSNKLSWFEFLAKTDSFEVSKDSSIRTNEGEGKATLLMKKNSGQGIVVDGFGVSSKMTKKFSELYKCFASIDQQSKIELIDKYSIPF